jgi:UDP-glucose 4-epimerase
VYAGSSSHHSGKFKNPYTFSKDIGEEIINLYQTHFELKASIARFYNVYGPHHLKEGGYCTLIGKWENLIEKGLPLEVYGDGEKRRDFTHINDIVDALILIEQKQAWGHIFELGRGKNYSINDIAEMFGKVKIHLGEKPGEAQVTLCDSTLAKDVLGWVPKINIEDYIKEYLTK